MLSKLSKLARRPVINTDNGLRNLKPQKRNFGIATIGYTALGLTAATSAYAASMYKVAKPSEYLCKTGIFIDDIDISKKTFWLPFQTLTYINLEPINIHCVIEEGMSKERISFNLVVKVDIPYSL